MPWTLEHIKWLIDTGERLQTADGMEVEVWDFRHEKIEHHDYQLYLTINDIDHTKNKAMSPQKNGICECLHKTILHEFCQVTFRKKLYTSFKELQKDLDEWLDYHNNE